MALSGALAEVLVIFGPTASGKTGASIEAAKLLGGEVINADSRQIYSRMPILSAAPTAAEKGDVPHHLFEMVDPAERVSAGRWAEMALQKIEEVLARGKRPIVVGGTGLYLRTLMEGISEIPPVPEEMEALFRGRPVEELYEELLAVDPNLAAKLHATDTQRITRGLVVHHHTGTPLSAWQAVPAKAPPYTFRRLAISPERDELYARIEKRWGLMVDAGMIAEVEALKNDGYTLAMPGLQGLGAEEIYDFLDGVLSWEEASRSAVQGTRHYAKRQVTWLRNTYGAEETFENAGALVAWVREC